MRELMGELPERPTIDDIARHRYETGAFGSAHFLMSHAYWGRLRDRLPEPTPSIPDLPDPLADLMAIPIRLDYDLPPDVWRLVDRDGTVLHEGRA